MTRRSGLKKSAEEPIQTSVRETQSSLLFAFSRNYLRRDDKDMAAWVAEDLIGESALKFDSLKFA
jgi:hypothetical protein